MATVSHYVNYSAIATTNTFHKSPRFGHSNDFANIFSENQNTQSDYIRGVIFAGVLILSFFFVWLLLLWIFKCLGDKVGFLSGGRMLLADRNQRGCTRPNTVRSLFCLSTLLVIGFTIVLVTKGLNNLKNTTSSLDQSNLKVSDIILQFQGIATDLRTVGNNANQTRSQIISQLQNFCPNGGNLTGQFGNFKAAGQQTAALLSQLGDFIGSDVANAQQSLTKAQHTTVNLHKALNQFDFHSLTISFVIIYIVLPTCILLGVLMAWCGCFNPCVECMLSWFLLPMWVLMIVIAIVCTALSSWMVIANADFCSGGQMDTPDATVEQILAYRNVTTSSFLGKVTSFYVTQCLTTDPWYFIRGFEANLTAANETINGLVTDLNQAGLSTLQTVCGQNYAPFLSLLAAMEVTLGTLFKDAVLALNLLSCDNIVPIYTNTAYNTSCEYSIAALSWSFASFLVISFFGMMMITLRSSWHNVKYLEDEPKYLDPAPPPFVMENGPPDDEDQPPRWNSVESSGPVVDYGDGRNHEEDAKEFRASNHQEQGDLASYQEEGDRHVVYHDEPQVIREYDDKQHDNNGLYRSSAY